MYLVTKHFVSGLLAGLVVTERTRVSFITGKVYTPCAGSSSYVVTQIKEIAQ